MQSVFEMIIFVCSIVGLVSVAHLATLFVRSRVISALDMTKIGTGSLAMTLLSFFWCPPEPYSSLFLIWFQIHAPITAGVFFAILLAKRRDRLVVESLDEVLSRLMMRMKEGRSLAVALDLVVNEIRPSLRPRWLEITRSVSFSPQKNVTATELKSLRLAEIARELRRVDQMTRSQLVELERWRARVRTECTFRRRSVQATAQVRAQSIVLSAIYLLIALFSMMAFGWNATKAPIQISVPIFSVGLFIIWRGGRRVKWSI